MAEYCLPTIVENINRLGGLDEQKIVPRKIDLKTAGRAQQLILLDTGSEDSELD